MMIKFIYLLHTVWLVAANGQYPCPFIDTVNITGNYHHELLSSYNNNNNNNYNNNTQLFNNSYIYEWMVIPPDLVTVYDFILENGVKKPAVKHLRACVCKIKPCLRFCCPPGQYYNVINKTCLSMSTMLTATSTLEHNNIIVHLKDGSKQNISTAQHFLVKYGRPCESMRYLVKDHRYISWRLYENGTIGYKSQIFWNYYCFNAVLEEQRKPKQMNSAAMWQWQPLVCIPERLPFVLGVKQWTYAICLVLTVICMIIIFFVYLLCTELRNTFFGVAIKAYTLCIIIGYSLLAHLTLTNPNNMSKQACSKIPTFALMHLMLSFYILTLIGCNFYLSFFGIILSKLMFWFILLPMVVVASCWSFFVSFGHYNNKPIFGHETCWFDPRNYSIVMYLYIPVLVACIFNGIFYILSLLKLSEGLSDNISKPLGSVARNRFKTFWKFFGYTLCTWLVCLGSFAVNYYRQERTHINYVVAVFIAFHGFGSLYTLVGKNQQIQNFLRRMEDDEDSDDMADISMALTNF